MQIDREQVCSHEFTYRRIDQCKQPPNVRSAEALIDAPVALVTPRPAHRFRAPGCEMGIDPAAVPGCAQLIDYTALNTHGCGVVRQFGGATRSGRSRSSVETCLVELILNDQRFVERLVVE